MSRNTLTIAQVHRLHNAVGALPVPTIDPSLEERELILNLEGQTRDGTLILTGTGTLSAPIIIHGFVDYVVGTGAGAGEAIDEWVPQDTLLAAGTLTLPATFNAIKLSPAFRAFRLSAVSVSDTVSVDLIKEADQR